MARTFADGLDASQLAYYVGLWHDLGKFHPEFQDYLARCEANPTAHGHGPDHKGAGADIATRHFPVLSLVVQGHHGGLQSPALNQAWLNDRKRGSALGEALALARAAIPDLDPHEALRPPDFALNDGIAAELFLRLVFSALVDADFLDTERHFNDQRSAHRGSAMGPPDLLPLLVADQDALMANARDSVVNNARRAVYEACMTAAQGATGFYRLTVPTGGGKTRAAMAFALNHARQHGLNRVIVGVPFISITEQTTSVYREMFAAAGGDVVLEHHSLADQSVDEEDDFHRDQVWDRLAAENWDAPIVVTTTVQIFESLFSNRTSRTRKLHRLARSVIVLDEAQALPPRLLKPILDVLRQLVEHYGATVVLSTATQPAFDSIPIFADVEAIEIVPEPARYFDALRRVEYEWLTEAPLTPAEVGDRLVSQGQALAVLNTKKDALAVLDELDASARPTAPRGGDWQEWLDTTMRDAPALHLSTLLCGAHRRDVIRAIKGRLDARLPCRVTSTQVIEAGVDLDFPFVMRALAPLDSIIQTAGRCNREGKLPAPGKVIVFEPAGGGLPQGSYRIGTDVTRALRRAGGLDPHAPEAARRYFQRLFGAVDTDAERIQERRRHLNYPEVARDFRMIEDETYSIVITSYGNQDVRQGIHGALDELREGTPRGRDLHRMLQPYVVGLRFRQVETLRRRGLVDEVRPGLGIWLGGYDAVRGLVAGDVEPDALVI